MRQRIINRAGFAEKLFRRLESSNDRFEYKLLMMAMISRLIGTHQLLIMNYYNYLQKYLKPHQREVTKILLYAAQASNELVPPDVIESVIRSIVNNFVTERNSSEVITVGINAVREIASNCPLAIGEDLLHDLSEYKTYKNKNVHVAARSLITLYRSINPGLLKKKDRGKPTEFTAELEPRGYAASAAVDFVPGAEVLAEKARGKDEEGGFSGSEEDDESDDANGYGSDDEMDDEDEEPVPSTSADGQLSTSSTDPPASSVAKPVAVSKAEAMAQRKAAATDASTSRVLTQADHERIRARQIAKRLNPSASRKRRRDEGGEEEAEMLDNDEDDHRPGLTRLADIERLHKKPKQDKQSRMESVMTGREGREKFGQRKKNGPHVGRTNRSLAKNKAFSMVIHKQRGKKKRSFKDKQVSLRNAMKNDKRKRK